MACPRPPRTDALLRTTGNGERIARYTAIHYLPKSRFRSLANGETACVGFCELSDVVAQSDAMRNKELFAWLLYKKSPGRFCDIDCKFSTICDHECTHRCSSSNVHLPGSILSKLPGALSRLRHTDSRPAALHAYAKVCWYTGRLKQTAVSDDMYRSQRAKMATASLSVQRMLRLRMSTEEKRAIARDVFMGGKNVKYTRTDRPPPDL